MGASGLVVAATVDPIGAEITMNVQPNVQFGIDPGFGYSRLVLLRAIVAALLIAGTTVAVASPVRGPLLAGADLIFHDPAKRDRLERVVVEAWPERPTPGLYLLLDTQGVIAELELQDERTRSRGGCPFHVELGLLHGVAARVPAQGDHVVVVGPIHEKLHRARLLRFGLALAGHVASAASEPLGLAPPPSGVPSYAVDLLGDGTRRIALVIRDAQGPVAQGRFEVTHERTVWRRDSGTAGGWREAARCAWKAWDGVD